MTEQYSPENINYGPAPSFAISTSLDPTDQQGSDPDNDTVFFFISVTLSSADHFTVTSSAVFGTSIAILQPGIYIASLTAGGATSLLGMAISLGGTLNSFGTTPSAIGGTNGVIALARQTSTPTNLTISVPFIIAPLDIDGTANIVRFLGDANGIWDGTRMSMRIFRTTAV